MAKFKVGDKVKCIGSGWRNNRMGSIESVTEGGEGSPDVYSVFFPSFDRSSYVTENELEAWVDPVQ